MKSAAVIDRTDVHEFTARQPRFSNMESALGRIAGLKKAGGELGKRLESPLLEHTANIKSGEVKESGAISEIRNVEKELASFAKAAGLSRVAIGGAGQYVPESGELRLEPEGALAAAIMAKFFGPRLQKAGTAIKELLEGGAVASGTGEEEIATACFTLHVCRNGIDSVFRDLELGEKLKSGLAAGGGGELVEGAQLELLLLHLDFAKVLYLGSKAEIS